jgi:hypothetical protein
VKPDGSKSHTVFGLHGRIASIPASYVAVHVAAEPPHEITVEGHVVETRVFGPQIRMKTRITTVPGANYLHVRDEFENLKDQPCEMQILYHWNFGPPFLDAGARFVAPYESVVPRDAAAQAALEHYDVYAGPKPGFAEEVYYFKLHDAPANPGKTKVMLRNQHGDKGVVLEFRTDQLPAFTLWKNTAGLRDGYVTGLEPGTNYPNPRPFEQARDRVVRLPVDGRYVTETTMAVFANPEAVAAAGAEIAELRARGAPKIHPSPIEPFAPEG